MGKSELCEWLRSIKAVEERSKQSFNLFQILRIQNRELLVCRFFGELLNPQGSHTCGTAFLECFLSIIAPGKKPYAQEELRCATVQLEEYTDENRRVDITIHVSRDVYPIEVKLWAGDQPKQLGDYWRYYDKQGALMDRIYYLTPDGREPTQKSIDGIGIENFCCISFQKEIAIWLKACLKNRMPIAVRSSMEQFLEVIVDMCESYRNKEAVMDAVFSDEKALSAAMSIVRYGDTIMKHFQVCFIEAHIELPLGWELRELTEEESKSIKYGLRKVVKAPNKILGYVCNETNLYLFINKENAEPIGHWKEEATQWPWIYLSFERGSGHKINLKEPWKNAENPISIPIDRKINLKEYLTERV